jgi:predicted trehalose synthase
MSEAELDLEELTDWLVGRRWFASKSRELSQVGVIDMPLLAAEHPQLRIALVEAHFGTGTHEIYQVPVALTRHGDESVQPEARIAGLEDGGAVYDMLAERRDPPRLLRLIVGGGQVASAEGRVVFGWTEGAAPPPEGAEARPIASEQSNSSVVFGENAILKVYRRVEAGVNPELEMLRFLGERGFGHVPKLLGWYEYEGRPADATLGVVQEFIADGRDGWQMVLDGLAADPDALLGPLRALGRTVGEMHTALASDPTDPVFAPEERGNESLALYTASLDESIERAFLDLPEDERLEPIAHRGEELRDQLRALAGIGGAGMAIRVHGDLHLGQALWSDRGWTILDFEGEPARPLPERRTKSSPLRDVAGILRSLAYAPLAARLQRSASPPDGWELRARQDFLDGYLDSIDPTLLPATRREVDQLLAIYELEKAVYELNYELNNRPDWVEIPVAGITRLLEVEVA